MVNDNQQNADPKIIILPHGFEPNYTMGFLKGLAANGLSPLVISADIDHQRILDCGIDAINLRGSQDSDRSIPSKIFTLCRYYVRLLVFLFRRRGSIIHFTGLFRNSLILFEGILLNLFLAAISRCYIYTVHNVLPHSREKSLFFRWVYRLVYTIPSILVVHTQLAREQLIHNFHVAGKKIRVISIGINEEMPVSSLTREEARKSLGFGEGDKILLFFGKADEYKGLDILIEAFGGLQISSLKLLISCWFPNPSFRVKIHNAIESSYRKGDIHLHEGFLDNRDVEIYFKSADVLMLPYRNIYQSGVVFLGFHFGLPIVATDVGSLREFIEPDLGLITRSNDVRGVAEGIEAFFIKEVTPSPRRIQQIIQKYRWDHICSDLLPLYRRFPQEL